MTRLSMSNEHKDVHNGKAQKSQPMITAYMNHGNVCPLVVLKRIQSTPNTAEVPNPYNQEKQLKQNDENSTAYPPTGLLE